MHVVLVGPELEENLSIRYLAAALRQAGHTASLAPFGTPEDIQDVVEQVRREQPGLVGLSLVFQLRGRDFYDLARALRRARYQAHITAGGHFATFAYETILADLPELDSVVRQEGEQTIVELADGLERGMGHEELARIPGMVVRSQSQGLLVAPPRLQVDGLDSLPFPARDTPPELHLGVPTAYLVGSRGCYAACDYCCIHAWHEAALGKRFRLRSPQNLAEEMAVLYNERGIRNFIFHDDNFFLPSPAAGRRRFEALREETRKRKLDGIGLVVKLRPGDCDRENLLILKDIGLLRAFVGIENTSQRQLRSLGREVTEAQLETCLDVLRDLDLYSAYNILLFDPYTTLDDVATNLRFLRGHPHYPFNWCRVEVYAGTALEKRYQQEGRLRGDYLSRGYDIEDSRVRLMYELMLPAIYDRNFYCQGLANLTIGLGYHRQLLKHFHPGRCSPDLSARVQGVMEAVSSNALDLLEQTHEFVSAVNLNDHFAIDRFGAQLKRDSLDAQQVLTGRVEAALCEIDRAAGVRQHVHRQPTPDPATTGWRLTPRRIPRRALLAAIGSGLAWLLTGCPRGQVRKPPPIVDPPPPPMDKSHQPPTRPPVPDPPPPPTDKHPEPPPSHPSVPDPAPPPMDKHPEPPRPPVVDPPSPPMDKPREPQRPPVVDPPPPPMDKPRGKPPSQPPIVDPPPPPMDQPH